MEHADRTQDEQMVTDLDAINDWARRNHLQVILMINIADDANDVAVIQIREHDTMVSCLKRLNKIHGP